MEEMITMASSCSPKRDILLLISGKRKSGKDYICEEIVRRLGENKASIMRISAPLKGAYAENNNLNTEELMSPGIYKEKYRLDMIKWSDEIRQKDPGYFCRLADEMTPTTQVTLVSDIRRKTDLYFFENNFAKITKRIRITADVSVREKRGYSFTPGVDDSISECDLDDVNSWNLILNNNSREDGEHAVNILLHQIKQWQEELSVSNQS